MDIPVPPVIQHAGIILALALVVELACVIGRIKKGPMRNNKSVLSRITGGVRIHHGYWIVLVPASIVWEKHFGASAATEWLAVAGWALGVSDLWRHFFTLPTQGCEHEFDLVFHSHPSPPSFLVRLEKSLAESLFFLSIMQLVMFLITAWLICSFVISLLRYQP